MVGRRSVIQMGAAAALLSACGAVPDAPGAPAGPPDEHAGHPGSDGVAPAGGTVAAFTVPMPVPPVLAPSSTDATTDYYTLAARAGTEQLKPGVNTAILGFNGAYVGPTIRARRNRRVVVSYTNQLGEVTAVHLHGGHTAPSSDGFPTDTVAPGGSRGYEYANAQRAATLWYHDHAHHLESEHLYRGLHGFYLIDDPADDSLQLPSGGYDVPIMLTDARFAANGSLVFTQNDLIGRTSLLANGRVTPFFAVAKRKYRFRFLNASNLRPFTLQLGSLVQMTQVGTDGGLLPNPVQTPVLVLSPGERVDVVINFAPYPIGTQLVLRDVTGGSVLRFDVTSTASDNSQVPGTLRALPPLGTPTMSRTVNLSSSGSSFTVNGRTFDPNRVDTSIRAGATELWTVVNNDPGGHVHNLHLHLVQFRVLDRNGRQPEPWERGMKDTVMIGNRETVRLQVTFGTQLGRSVYHCHFIDHSALGMMARMDIVP